MTNLANQIEALSAAATPGPWEYVPSNENHGPYVSSEYGSDVCDFYTMSKPDQLSLRNGGESKPIHFLHEMADPNAELATTLRNAVPQIVAALRAADEAEALRARVAELESGIAVPPASGADDLVDSVANEICCNMLDPDQSEAEYLAKHVMAFFAPLIAERDAALAKLAEAGKNWAESLAEVNTDLFATKAKLAAAEAREGVLREALLEYGDHLTICEAGHHRTTILDCTCGYSAALATEEMAA